MSSGRPDELLRVYQLLSKIHAEQDLAGKMQAVADAVVDAVGFDLAALNVLSPLGDFEVVAVAGSHEARLELLGVRLPQSAFDAEFANAEHWGLLRFIPHERAPEPYPGSWIPDISQGTAEDSWHPLDALLAPLRTSEGELIGVLSVDLPRDRLRPSVHQRGLLEILATEAGIAIHNGMLAEKLRLSEENFRQAFDGSAVGMALIDVEHGVLGQFSRVNPVLLDMLGYELQTILLMTEQGLTHADDLANDQSSLNDLLAGRVRSCRRDKRLRQQNGRYLWVTVTSTITRNRDGSPRNAVSQIEDISAARTELESLQFKANHDELTKLPHRASALARLVASIDSARRTGRTGAVLFLDLNDFKSVNDRFGHAAGDQVLITLARRIKSSVRDTDLVARLGGDEFVVIADGISSAEIDLLTERICAAVAEPIVGGSGPIVVTVSVGSSVIDMNGGDAATFLREADLAMYRRKVANEKVPGRQS